MITNLNEIIHDEWKKLKKKDIDHEKFCSHLEQLPNIEIGIFGGAIRDWYLEKEPKDIDLVIKNSGPEYNEFIKKYRPGHNNFGGNVIVINRTLFDIWKLEETKPFTYGIDIPVQPSWGNLIKSVPFNIDSIVTVLYHQTYQYKFFEGLEENKIIEFVNKINPNPGKIARRALKFIKKYDLSLSKEVADFVAEHKYEQKYEINEKKYSSNDSFNNLFRDIKCFNDVFSSN